MPRWVLGVLVTLLFLFGITGIFYTTATAPVVQGPYSRSVEPRAVFGRGPVQVRLTFDPTGLPVCAAEHRASDIVLLLDSSSSMSGRPFEEAIAAAQTFINWVDLAVSRVGIVYFNNTATADQPLSSELSLLDAALEGGAPGGGHQYSRRATIGTRPTAER